MHERSVPRRRNNPAALAGLLSLGALAGTEEGCALFPTRDYLERQDMAEQRDFRSMREVITFFREPGMGALLSEMEAMSEPGTPEFEALQALRVAGAELAPLLRRAGSVNFPADSEPLETEAVILAVYNASETRGSDFVRRVGGSLEGIRSLDTATRRQLLGDLYGILRTSPRCSAAAAQRLALEMTVSDRSALYRMRSREIHAERAALDLGLESEELRIAGEMYEHHVFFLGREGIGGGRIPLTRLYYPRDHRFNGFREARVLYMDTVDDRSSWRQILGRMSADHTQMTADHVATLSLRVGIRAAAALLREIEMDRAGQR